MSKERELIVNNEELITVDRSSLALTGCFKIPEGRTGSNAHPLGQMLNRIFLRPRSPSQNSERVGV
jgi:hypothetical protein